MLVTIVKTRKALSTTHILLTNLVTSGLLFSIVLPTAIATRITEEWKFGVAFCKAFNHIEFVSAMSSNLTLTAISYDRYMTIKNNRRQRLRKLILMAIIVIIWTTSSLFALPISLYQDVKVFNKKEEICQNGPNNGSVLPPFSENHECRMVCRPLKFCGISWPNDVDMTYYLLTLCLAFYIVPLISFCVFYTAIFLIVRKSSRRIASHRSVSVSHPLPSSPHTSKRSQHSFQIQASRQEIRLVQMSGIIISTFVAMWSPFFIMTSVNSITHSLSSSTYLFGIICIHVNICINPIIYGYFNPAFRDQCREVPRKLLKFITSIMSRLSTTSQTNGTSNNREQEQEMAQRSRINVPIEGTST